MIAGDLWVSGYQHLGCHSKPPQTPEHMALLRNTLGPDALRAESFYVHPTTGKTYGCDSPFVVRKSNVWPVESALQPHLV
jgi:hypothetical protein